MLPPTTQLNAVTMPWVMRELVMITLCRRAPTVLNASLARARWVAEGPVRTV